MANGFLEDLFSGQPRTAFDAYNDTASSLNKLRSQKIANALNQIKLNYAPQMAQQGADLGAANVAIKQSDAQYEPQMNAADLMTKHLSAQGQQLTNAMNSEKFKFLPTQLQQGIALKAAQIDKIKNDIKVASQKANTQQGHLGAAFNFRQMLNSLSPAARAAYIASHPDQVNQVLGGVLNQAAGAYQPSPQSNAPAPAPSGMNVPSPMTGASQNAEAPTNMAPGNAPQTTTQPLPFAAASEIAANKYSVTNATTKRSESAVEIENILNNPKYDALAKNAAKYAGIGGKIQGGIQALQKTNPKEYEDYLQFRNQFSSMVTNLSRQLEGLGVQESTRNELMGNLTQAFDQYSSNPARAMDQYNRFKDQTKDLARSISAVAQPVFAGSRERASGINTEQKSNNNETVDVISPDGREGTIPQANLEKALSRGYKRAP